MAKREKDNRIIEAYANRPDVTATERDVIVKLDKMGFLNVTAIKHYLITVDYDKYLKLNNYHATSTYGDLAHAYDLQIRQIQNIVNKKV